MVTELTGRILVALGEGFRSQAGDALPDLVDGLTGPMSEIDERLQPSARGWARAFDLDETPDPRWIGAITGSTVPGGLDLEEQRAYVRDRAVWRRGTPAAIKGAVRSLLVGQTRRVDIVERDGSPWRIKVRVWASELTETGTAGMREAAKTQTPVGIVVDTDVEVVPYNATYAHLSEEHGTYAALATRFPAPAAAAAHVPEEGTVF